MSDLENQQRIDQATYLRVYYGEEDLHPNPQGQSLRNYCPSDAEMATEAFWAGRSPAARHSTRVVA